MTEAHPTLRSACPNCGLAITSGAALCTSCGCNTQTGQVLQTNTAAPQAAKPVSNDYSSGSDTFLIISQFLFPVIGAAISGAIAAAAWYAMVYYGNVEIGIVAAGVGALCGAGSVMASPDDGNWWSGSVAVVFSLLSIYIAKVALFGPGVTSSFGVYDGIWGLFAIMAAWHIGSGQFGD